MIIKPNMGLEVPEVGDSDYPNSIATSFDNIDAHDHTAGAGVQIPSAGIEDLAITAGKLAASAVTTAKILDLNVTTGKLADNAVTRPKLVAVGQQVATMGVLTFSTQSQTFVNVTGLSVTITTTGRPVMLMLTSNSITDSHIGFYNPTANQDTYGFIRFGKGGVDLAVFNLKSQVTSTASSSSTTTVTPPNTATTTTTTTISTANRLHVPASLSFLDTPVAGTYTYTVDLRAVQPMVGPAVGTVYLTEAKLIAFEL